MSGSGSHSLQAGIVREWCPHVDEAVGLPTLYVGLPTIYVGLPTCRLLVAPRDWTNCPNLVFRVQLNLLMLRLAWILLSMICSMSMAYPYLVAEQLRRGTNRTAPKGYKTIHFRLDLPRRLRSDPWYQ